MISQGFSRRTVRLLIRAENTHSFLFDIARFLCAVIL